MARVDNIQLNKNGVVETFEIGGLDENKFSVEEWEFTLDNGETIIKNVVVKND